MKNYFFELPVGLSVNGETHRNVELLRTNGIAEKVFTTKLSEKPFTWQANVVSVATKSIGTIEIGADARKSYQENGSVTIPDAVMYLPLAELNTMIVEIHRRCWVSKIPKQEVPCKYCGKRLLVDIDLDKIEYSKESMEKLEAPFNTEEFDVMLEDGFIPPVIPKITDKPEYAGITETEFNRMTFRVPLVHDAIKHEAHASDSIGFWRRIAMDCLLSIDKVDEKGEVVESLPANLIQIYSLKILNEYLSGIDLKTIRREITEYLPTLPFAYYEECGCDRKLEIPVAMEASNFFSE